MNRNRITLPNNARSISLQNIDNKSYTPGLDVLLRELLIDRFSRNAVNIQAAQTADLSLQFQLDSARYDRQDYAVDNSVTTYQFTFSVSGRLTVVNNTTNSELFTHQTITGTYVLRTESTDLSQTEIIDGREEALENLSDNIVAALTQDF